MNTAVTISPVMIIRSLSNTLLLIILAARVCSAGSTIPVRVVSGGLVLVPLSVKNRTFEFLIDSGSTSSSIDSSAASALGLETVGRETVEKNFRETTTNVVLIPKFTIGSDTFTNIELAELNLSPLAGAVGTHVDGVLGNDVLEKMVFQLIYSKQVILLQQPNSLKAGASKVPLVQQHDQFLISTKLVSTKANLILDTGTNSTNLSWSTWAKLIANWRPPEVVEGVQRAGNPTSPAILVCLPRIELGGTQITDASVRAQSRSTEGAFSNEDFPGILGADVLRHFEVGFDLGHGQIFLKPDPRYKPDPYRYVTVGIQIGKNSFGSYQVMAVWKNSPAAVAGVQQGDILMSINGQSVGNLDVDQASKRLHAKEGSPIELTVERDGVHKTMRLRTRRLLCTSDGRSTSAN